MLRISALSGWQAGSPGWCSMDGRLPLTAGVMTCLLVGALYG
jgi:hypothetical protein